MVKVGLTLSVTVTVKVQGALTLPHESCAVLVTVVTPSGKWKPDGGMEVMMGDPSQLSFAVTVKLTTVPPVPVHATVIEGGQVTVGGVLSILVV
jgi:hypothetical protein